MAFNVVANLQLQGPTNLGPVINNIQNALKNIQATITVNVSAGTSASLSNLNKQFTDAQQNINAFNSSAGGVSQSTAGIASSTANAARATQNLSHAASSGATDFQKLASGINTATSSAENFGKAAGLAARRYTAFLIAGGGIVSLVQGFQSAIGAALDFDRELVKLTQVGAGTKAEIRGIQDEITRLSTGLGVSSKELSNAAVLIASAGFNAKDTKIALEALAQAAISPNFGDFNATAQGSIAILQQFKLSTEDLAGALGSINAVSSQFAVESKDLIEGVKRAGGAFKSSGGDLNEFIALFTSVRSTTRESAESIATGLRTIFTKIQSKDTVNQLKDLGINLRFTREEALALGNSGLEQQFVGPYQAIVRLNAALKDVSTTDPRYGAIIEQLGGYRQISRVLPLIQELTQANKALTTAQYGQFSIQTAADQAQDATLIRITKLKEEFNALFRTITESKGFRTFLDGAILLATSLAKVSEVLTPLIPLLGGLAAIKIGQSLAPVLGGLAAGLGGAPSSPIKKNRGGFIHHFAGGGEVPGVGDSDTVPAVLTPGEYVIRKQAVQAIGVDNLHAMNGYNRGGYIKTGGSGNGRKFEDGGSASKINQLNRKDFAALKEAIISTKDFKSDDPAVISTNQYIADSLGGLPGLNNVKRAAKIREFKKSFALQENTFKSLDRGLGTTEKEIGGKIQEVPNLVLPFNGDSMGMLTIGSAQDAGLQLIQSSSLSDSNENVKAALKLKKVRNIQSGVNVHILSSAGSNKFKKEYEDKINPALATLFPAETGVKLNLDKSARSTIGGYLFEAFIGGVSGALSGGSTETFDYPKGKIISGARASQIAKHSYPDIIPGEFIDAKKVSNIRVTAHDIVKKYANYTSNDGSLYKQLGVTEAQVLKQKKEGDDLLKNGPVKKASGGGISGGNGIDALLTPGEFVFSKEAVASHGITKMNELNVGKKQKFAKGGIVGPTIPIELSKGQTVGQIALGGTSQELPSEVPLSDMSQGSIFSRTLRGYISNTSRFKNDKIGGSEEISSILNNFNAKANISNIPLKSTSELAKNISTKNLTIWQPIEDAIKVAIKSQVGEDAEIKSRPLQDKALTNSLGGYILEGGIAHISKAEAAGGNASLDFRKLGGEARQNLLQYVNPPTGVVPNNIDSKRTFKSANSLSKKALNANLFDISPILEYIGSKNRKDNEALGYREYKDVNSLKAIGATHKNVTTKVLGNSAKAEELPVIKKSGGGRVNALLTPGEFVMGTSAVRRHGGGLMNAINSGTLPRFAAGGPVSSLRHNYGNFIPNNFQPKNQFSAFGETVASPKVNINIASNIETLKGSVGQIVDYISAKFGQGGLSKILDALAIAAEKAGVKVEDLTRNTKTFARINENGEVLGASLKTPNIKGKISDINNELLNRGIPADQASQYTSPKGDLNKNIEKRLIEQNRNKLIQDDKDKLLAAGVNPQLSQQAIDEKLNKKAYDLPAKAKAKRALYDKNSSEYEELQRSELEISNSGVVKNIRYLPPPVPTQAAPVPDKLPGESFDSLAKSKLNKKNKETLIGLKIDPEQADEFGQPIKVSKALSTKNLALIKQDIFNDLKQQQIAEETKGLGFIKIRLNKTQRELNAQDKIISLLEAGARIEVDINTGRAKFATKLNSEGKAEIVTGGIIDRKTLEKLKTERAAAGEAAGSSGKRRVGGQALLIGGLLANQGASYVTSAIDKYSGKPGESLTESGIASSRSGAGTSGAITGAVLGATLLGTALPGLGHAVGAVAGGLIGYTTSIIEADKQIREAQLGKSVIDTKLALDTFNNDTSRFTLTGKESDDLVKQSEDKNSFITSKSVEASTSFLGNLDETKLKEQLQKNQRETLGPLLPLFAQTLQKQAEGAGKAASADFGKSNTAGADFSAKLFSNPANAKLLKDIASTKGTSEASEKKAFEKTFVTTQRQSFLENEGKRTVLETEKLYQAFGRLTSSVESAAHSVNNLERVSATLESAFEGVVGKVNFTNTLSGNFKDLGAQNRKEFSDSSDILTKPFGKAGENFNESLKAANDLSAALPNVLNSVLQRSSLDPEGGFGKQTRDALSQNFGGSYESISGPLKTFIDSARLEIDKLTPKDIRQEGAVDVNNLSKKILQPQAVLAQEAEKLSAGLEKNANGFLAGLTKISQFKDIIGQGRDNVSEIRKEKEVRGVRRAFADVGRANEADDAISLANLQKPFKDKQQRLTGLSGDDVLSPAKIAAALRDVNKALPKASDAAQREIGKPGEAVKEFDRLQDKSKNLTKALENLTKSTETTSAIQEKLNAIQQDKEGRLSLGEKYISGDSNVRGQIEKGFALFQVASKQGHINNFNDDQRKSFFETANSLKGVKIPGLGDATDLKNKIINESHNGIFAQTGENKDKETNLKDQLSAADNIRLAAEKALIETRTTLQNSLFTNLEKIQEKFFARLNQNLRQDEISKKVGEGGGLIAEKNKQQSFIDAREVITSSGINASAIKDISKNGSARKEFENLIKASKESKDADINHYDSIRNTDFKGLTEKQSVEKLNNINGIDSLDAIKIQKEAISKAVSNVEPEATNFVELFNKEFARLLPSIVNRTLSEKKTSAEEKLQDSSTALSKKTNIDNISSLQQNLPIKSDNILSSLDKLQGINLENLSKNFEKASDAVTDFQKALNILKDKLYKDYPETRPKQEIDLGLLGKFPLPGQANGGLIYRAGGGDIYTTKRGETVPNLPTPPGVERKGTDSVFAVLTPGEFVVRAPQAAANMELLHQINSGQGRVSDVEGFSLGGGVHYLAGGGPPKKKVDPIAEGIKKEVAKAVAARLGGGAGVAAPQIDPFAPPQPDENFRKQLEDLQSDELEFAYQNAKIGVANYYKQNLALNNQQGRFIARTKTTKKNAAGRDAYNTNVGKFNDAASSFINPENAKQIFEADNKEDKIKVVERLPVAYRNQLLVALANRKKFASDKEGLTDQQFKDYYIKDVIPNISERVSGSAKIIEQISKKITDVENSATGTPETRAKLVTQQASWQAYNTKWKDVPQDPAEIDSYDFKKDPLTRQYLTSIIKELTFGGKPVTQDEAADFINPELVKAQRLAGKVKVKGKKVVKNEDVDTEEEAVKFEANAKNAETEYQDYIKILNDEYGEGNWTEENLTTEERKKERELFTKKEKLGKLSDKKTDAVIKKNPDLLKDDKKIEEIKKEIISNNNALDFYKKQQKFFFDKKKNDDDEHEKATAEYNESVEVIEIQHDRAGTREEQEKILAEHVINQNKENDRIAKYHEVDEDNILQYSLIKENIEKTKIKQEDLKKESDKLSTAKQKISDKAKAFSITETDRKINDEINTNPVDSDDFERKAATLTKLKDGGDDVSDYSKSQEKLGIIIRASRTDESKKAKVEEVSKIVAQIREAQTEINLNNRNIKDLEREKEKYYNEHEKDESDENENNYQKDGTRKPPVDDQEVEAVDNKIKEIKDRQDILKENTDKLNRSIKFAKGGSVPGFGSGDTVPAMLTPGEFIVNKAAAQNIGHNNLYNMQRLAEGGFVNPQRLASGGSVGNGGGSGSLGISSDALSAISGFSAAANNMAIALNTFSSPANALASALTGFGSIATSLADSLGKIPNTITLEGRHDVNVVINGLQVLTALEPSIQKLVIEQTNAALDKFVQDKLPDLGHRV